jgi:hypothetical protein
VREIHDSNEWKVTIAARGDFDRWMDFVRKVQDVFHGIDLYNDKKHRKAVFFREQKEAYSGDARVTDSLTGFSMVIPIQLMKGAAMIWLQASETF